jgi:hypothetical protein
MCMLLSQPNEVVTVTRHKKTALLMSELQDGEIARFGLEDLAQPDHIVSELVEDVGQILRDVVIEQKLH